MYGFDTVGSFVLTWGCKAANECVDDWGVSRWAQIPKNNSHISYNKISCNYRTKEIWEFLAVLDDMDVWQFQGMMTDSVMYKPLQTSMFTTHMHHLSLNPYRQSPIFVNLLMCAACASPQRWRNWFDSQEIFKGALAMGHNCLDEPLVLKSIRGVE